MPERAASFADARSAAAADDAGVDAPAPDAAPDVDLGALGPVRVFVGQNTPDLSAFRAEVLDADPEFPRPDGVTLYTNIVPGTCSGTSDGACEIDGIVNDFGRTLDEYPNAALAVGLFLSDSFADCSNQPLRAILGRDDADLSGGLGAAYREELDALLVYLQGTGREVFLRVGYEFDGPWNCYDRDLYVAAFRHVKERIDALGAARVRTVWQSATYPRDGNANAHYDFSAPDHLEGWYPGDDVVDWVAFSAFSWDPAYLEGPWSCATPSIAPSVLYERIEAFAEARGKPLMIAESAPAGYRTQGDRGVADVGCVFGHEGPTPQSDDELWEAWFAPFFAFARSSPPLGIVAYINSDWEALPPFACPPGGRAGSEGCPNGYWGNSRIQDAPAIATRFAAEMRELQTR